MSLFLYPGLSRAQSAESPRKEATKKPVLGKIGNLFSSTRRRSSTKSVPGSPVSPNGEKPFSPTKDSPVPRAAAAAAAGGRGAARPPAPELPSDREGEEREQPPGETPPSPASDGCSPAPGGQQRSARQAAGTPGKKGSEAARGQGKRGPAAKPKSPSTGSPAANGKKPPLGPRGSAEAIAAATSGAQPADSQPDGCSSPDPSPSGESGYAKARSWPSTPEASPATVLKVDIYLSKTPEEAPLLSPEGMERERRPSLGSSGGGKRSGGKKRKALKSAEPEAAAASVPSSPSGKQEAKASGESEKSKQPLPVVSQAASPAEPPPPPPRSVSSTEDAPPLGRRRTRSFGKKPEGEPEKQQQQPPLPQQQHSVTIVQAPRHQGAVFTVCKPTVTSQISLPPKPKNVDLNLKAKSLDGTESASDCTTEQPIHKGNTASKISLFENKSTNHSQRQIDFPATKNISVQKKYVGRAKLTFGKQSKESEQPDNSNTNKQNSDQEAPRHDSLTLAELKSTLEEAAQTKTLSATEAGSAMVLKKKEKTLGSQLNQIPRTDNPADAALELAGTEPSMVNKDSTILEAASVQSQNNNDVFPENNQKNTILDSKPPENIQQKMMEEDEVTVSPVHVVDSSQAAGNMSQQKDKNVKFNGEKIPQLTENSMQTPENKNKKTKVKSPSRKTDKSSAPRSRDETEPHAVLESVSILHPTKFDKNGKPKQGEVVQSLVFEVDDYHAVPLTAEGEVILLKSTADEGQANVSPLPDEKYVQAIEAAAESPANKTTMKSPKKKAGKKVRSSEGVPALVQNNSLENTHIISPGSSEQTKDTDIAVGEITLSESNSNSMRDGREHLTSSPIVDDPDMQEDIVKLHGNLPMSHQLNVSMDSSLDFQHGRKAAHDTSLNQRNSIGSGNAQKGSSQNSELQYIPSTEPKEKQTLDPSSPKDAPESVPIQQETEQERSAAGLVSPEDTKVLSWEAVTQIIEDNSPVIVASRYSSSSSKVESVCDLQQDIHNVQLNEEREPFPRSQWNKKESSASQSMLVGSAEQNFPLSKNIKKNSALPSGISDNLPLDSTHLTVSACHSYKNVLDISDQNQVMLNNLPNGENERASLQSKSILTQEEEIHNVQETTTEVKPHQALTSHTEDDAPALDSDLKFLTPREQNASTETTVMSESITANSLYVNGGLENNLPFDHNVWCSPKTSENIFNVSAASDDSSLDSSSDMERFTEIIRKLDSPMTIPQKRKKPRPPRAPAPSFGLPPIHEDYLEKIFDSDIFTFGLGKKGRPQDFAPSMLLKKQNPENSPRLLPKHVSKEQSILLRSLRPSTQMVTEETDGKENDTGAVEIKRSRLENSKIFSSLQAPFRSTVRESVFSPSVTSIGSVTTTFTVSQNDSVSTGTSENPSINGFTGTPHMSTSVQDSYLDRNPKALSLESSKNSDFDKLNPSLSAQKDASYMENDFQNDNDQQEQNLQSNVQLSENRSLEPPKPNGISTADESNVPNTQESTATSQLPSNGSPETDFSSTVTSSNYELDVTFPAFDTEMFLGSSQEKINPRPGKVVIHSEPNLSGIEIEVYTDISDCTSWELSPEISIKVVRGCWLLYEKPDFEGLSIPLEEGEMELTNLWGDIVEEGAAVPAVIGSLRQVVKDYQVCQIDLFTEPEGLGLVTSYFDDTEDIQGYGKLQKTCSIKVHWGIWLIYEESGFQGIPFILEPGEYPDLAFWDTHEAYIGSMRPMKMGGHKVEIPNEPKLIVYEEPFFEGREVELEGEMFRFEVTGNDEPGEEQTAPFTTVGSLRVLGGVWVAYEKPGFEGYQYLLEEGDYQEWRDWGGYNKQLQSLRPLLTDFSAPHVIMYTEKDFGDKGSNINVLGIVSNLDDTGYGVKTRSINVLSGVWVAYEGPDFTGEQYILEKGMYSSFEDWGAKDCRISSIQPVVLDNTTSPRGKFKVQLFSEPDFQGKSEIFEESKKEMEPFTVQSCKVLAGSWVAFDGEEFSGNQFVLEEGAYPDVCALGCQLSTSFRSLQTIDFEFSEPSIVLYGKEDYKGKKREVTGETVSQQVLGYSPHIASLQVLGGIWIAYEYSHYRGRQKLLFPSHIPQWHTASGWQSIGSLRPLIQKRPYFRIRNQATGMFMSCAGSLEELKLLRIQVTEEMGAEEQIWLYQDGFIKCRIAEECCLDALGSLVTVGSKLGLSLEQNSESQCWSISPDNKIYSRLKPNLVLDVKGGMQYDQKHVILNTASEDKLTQCWELLVL
ncbi:beta/gamma crystallin domain-containing protein 1 isoform X2 [Rhinatrema bivittatum]|uniref:beta/gamma crystallin domain-containing protein 1 isoform X2 n=1 Tax=Rhinatrema bivittatum TaxID=194408 RepID=UPI00112DD3ED|nr:beta/gamma crystallin domain-containing protein 1 isoform X2 [Rhinatrema bivittatum]